MNPLDLAVIHDAKNNIGNIIFKLEAHGGCDAEIEGLLHTANRLTNLLLWHQQQEGQLHVRVESYSPVDLVSELEEQFSAFFPNIELLTDISQAPTFWFYDETMVRLALVNALHNAYYYTESTVTLGAKEHHGTLIFYVADNGKGYTKEVIAQHAIHAFAEITRRGTGLGLVLASQIADMHVNHDTHGKVVLKNENGGVFEMHLP